MGMKGRWKSAPCRAGSAQASATGRRVHRDAEGGGLRFALAHFNSNRVEAAYRRSDPFERRRMLTQDWAYYIGIGVPA